MMICALEEVRLSVDKTLQLEGIFGSICMLSATSFPGWLLGHYDQVICAAILSFPKLSLVLCHSFLLRLNFL